MDKFTYKNTVSNNKVLIVSVSSLARRIASEYLFHSSKLSSSKIKEEFQALEQSKKQTVFNDSEIILSFATTDFRNLNADGIVINLDRHLSSSMTYEDTEKTIHHLLSQIVINDIKPLINPHLSTDKKVCTCPDKVWRFQGCKCGAITPYVARY